MFKQHNPDCVAPPVASYSHGAEIAGNSRLLYVSGQIPQRRDGTVPDAIEEQVEAVWDNIAAVLESAGMKLTDIAKINTYLTRPEDLAPVREARARRLGDHRPASTTVIVTALAWPQFLLEVEVVAAKSVPPARTAASARKNPRRKPAKPAPKRSKRR